MSSRDTQANSGHGRLGNVLSGVAVAVGCLLFLGGFAWGALLYRPYTVPTDSMQPTVNPGDRVLAQRIHGDQVHRGDVVVFNDPLWGNEPMVKRVVAVGGDRIACCDKQGRLTVNGQPVDEPYLLQRGQAPIPATTVPRGQLFMLGDNRQVSMDSRVHLSDVDHGAVPSGEVAARVDAVVWPLGQLKEVTRPTAFAALPGGVSTPGPITWIASAVAAGVLLILGGAAYGPIAGRRRRRAQRRRVLAGA
ncbi:signal peptidase I [Streptomyces sp. RPT161]|uniref:signal peptidase I n=1 Tax=Streptomyces sp. RPT161 TaxID=3015993 RepID=UPI0022B8733F|nr:signal peptidase I [Streptomyces sp. RPT161]